MNTKEIIKYLYDIKKNVPDLIIREIKIGIFKNVYVITNETVSSSDRVNDFILKYFSTKSIFKKKGLSNFKKDIEEHIPAINYKSVDNTDTLLELLFSGFTILTDKPFTIGDWIEVGEYEGSVIDITFRSTRIKALNNTVITIPNSTITSTSVINWSRLTSRRFECVLNLSLDTTSEKVRKVGKEIKLVLQNNPEVIKETVEVNLDAISHSSSDIKIFCYVKQAEFRKYIKAKQDILCSILFLVEKENIDLAYPTQTVYVKNEKEEETE